MKILNAFFLIFAMLLLFTGCDATDIVAKYAVVSFEKLTGSINDKISISDDKNFHQIDMQDGNKLLISRDFSKTANDIIMLFDAEPYIKANLDPSKLPEDRFQFVKESNKILVFSDVSNDKFDYKNDPSIVDSFRIIVEKYRSLIGYHEKLDHYGLSFQNGNMFEWAKNIDTNDKDIVFVINPEPFIKAGLDTSLIKEWVFAKVEIKDKNNKILLVDKLLKPYNVK